MTPGLLRIAEATTPPSCEFTKYKLITATLTQQKLLASCTKEGRPGVPQDHAEAAKWYQKAADLQKAAADQKKRQRPASVDPLDHTFDRLDRLIDQSRQERELQRQIISHMCDAAAKASEMAEDAANISHTGSAQVRRREIFGRETMEDIIATRRGAELDECYQQQWRYFQAHPRRE
jgi:hypothetical protein